ncbi:hypothetical protein KBB12_02385 [Candidatus Woesebacteria bacterium]|nr:hypothetical protein [Candidatus Woesebacteria bacterium]
MGVEEGIDVSPVVQPEKTAGVEKKDVVELRTDLERELGISGAIEAIGIYLTKDAAPMVTADDVRRTLDRDGLTEEEVEELLQRAGFRRVFAWELDDECARLVGNVQSAEEDSERIQREEALERRKNRTEMQLPAIKDESRVWARPVGKESGQQWSINGKALGAEDINTLVREHITDLAPSFF